MNKEVAQYINELLNSEYDLMQDRKLDLGSNDYGEEVYDKEATESELEEIVNAQDFMTYILKEDN